jgi:hypothetical protein
MDHSESNTEGHGEFSTDLESWLRGDTPKTIGALADAFGEKSFAVVIFMLMFLSATPLPTGGITTVLEAITIIAALQMVFLRRTIWLPKWVRRRSLGAAMTGKAIPYIVRRLRWFEKHSRPRVATLFHQRWIDPILGVLIIVFTTFSAVAPPFSGLDTLPALGVVLICLAIILEDIVFAIVGTGIGAAGAILILLIGQAAARFIRGLF